MTDFTPTNPLEEALLEASSGGDAGPLFERLAVDPLYVPAQGDAPAEERQIPAGETIELPVFEHEGERYVPVFTSLERLAEGAPGSPSHLRTTGADLAAMWPEGHHLALNPGVAGGVAIAEDDLRALAGEQRVAAGSELTIGAPAEEPEALWARLRAWAAATSEVRSAHRALVLVHGEGAVPQLVVALEIDEDADPGRILRAGAEALEGEAAFTLLDPTADDPLAEWMLAQGHPLYTRAEG